MSFDETQKVKIASGPIESFHAGTTTNLYVSVNFPSDYTSITVSNDSSSDSLQFSYDGATLEGNLLANESITVNVDKKNTLYIKGSSGGGAYRLWGW